MAPHTASTREEKLLTKAAPIFEAWAGRPWSDHDRHRLRGMLGADDIFPMPGAPRDALAADDLAELERVAREIRKRLAPVLGDVRAFAKRAAAAGATRDSRLTRFPALAGLLLVAARVPESIGQSRGRAAPRTRIDLASRASLVELITSENVFDLQRETIEITPRVAAAISILFGNRPAEARTNPPSVALRAEEKLLRKALKTAAERWGGQSSSD